MDIGNLTGKTDDELDILQSKLASAGDAIVEAQIVIKRIRESKDQPDLPIQNTSEQED